MCGGNPSFCVKEKSSQFHRRSGVERKRRETFDPLAREELPVTPLGMGALLNLHCWGLQGLVEH